jgi:hypothetical protein
VARNENPPFERGQTFYSTSEVIDANNLGGVQLEGMEWLFEDIDPRSTGQGATARRTSRQVRCRVVRNLGAVTLFAGYLARFQKTAGKYGARVDGLCAVNGEKSYPIDEYLPSAGVRVNDLCYVVVEGPALCNTPLEANVNNVFNVGDVVMALTAATSGATTAGRVVLQDLTGATAILGNNVQNRIGMALTARTTGNTNTTILIDVGKW